ncbi:hypothetical protein HYH02_010235 [Chlamydomonas schloesseri]|uniref:RING-type domain-containing protein n=1 Tax=Chlamydomonas schloesseri TaxID=2026947 RepID=A0A835TAU7_9CHLO|nr:hypothetical protein HYH02_010235 [Chlamydomonas schloesseri]|eukprot:KAG2440656.1 hypothetical protein HYH02_010235 [Chlamydomonas schloesseri]
MGAFPAPLVFVMDGVPFDLHISLDVCPRIQLSSAGYRVALTPGSAAQEPTTPMPRLVPRRWREGEPHERPQAAPIWIANNTYDEAVGLVAARAGVRARLAAAAAGQDAAAAAARAVGEVELRYGEGSPGRMTGPATGHAQQPKSQQQELSSPLLDKSEAQGSVLAGAGSTDPSAGLPPLPSGLQARLWAEVAATHFPSEDTQCMVCAWSLTGTQAEEIFGPRNILQPTTRLTFKSPSEPNNHVLFFRRNFANYGNEWRARQEYSLDSSPYGGDVAAAIVDASGVRHAVIRAAVNYQGSTYMSLALAYHLGLRTVPISGAGARSLLGGGGGTVWILEDPIQLQLLDSSGEAVLSYDVPVMFVLEHTALDLQVASDVSQIATTGGTGHTFSPPGARGRQDDVALPRLVPRRWQQPGEQRGGLVTGTVRVSEEARQAALAYRARTAAAQAQVQAQAQAQAQAPTAEQCFGPGNIMRPAAPLRFVNPSEPGNEVVFFRGERWGYNELGNSSELVKDTYCVTGALGGGVAAAVVAGGTRHAVIRAVLNPSGSTYMSKELAQALGLRTVALGGGGAQSVLGGGGAVSMLVDPVQIQLLDTNGGAFATYAAPLVFVFEYGPFEMQIAADVCDIVSISGAGYTVALPDGRGGVRPPRLVPRRWQPGEEHLDRFTISTWVADDTYDEAVERVRARAAVRARVAAAAAGQDPVAASARADSNVERSYGAGAPGRPGQPGAAGSGRRLSQAPPQGPQQGTAEWMEDWLPQQFRGGGGGDGGGNGGGRAARRRRGRARNRRGGRGGAAAGGRGGEEDSEEEAEEGAAPAAAVAAVAVAARMDPFQGLPALPMGLRASRWAEVAATHVPSGDTECVVCAWSLTGEVEAGAAGAGGGEAGPGDSVVQLGCMHTFHELCVRQMLLRQSRACPLCRAAMGR